jgi:poly(hydroxyalkanoate) granule-associated protein
LPKRKINYKGKTMVEDIDINVSPAPQGSESSAASLFEGLRRLTLASIGAADMKREEIEAFVNKLVDRGDVAQQDGERLMRELRARREQGRAQVEQTLERGVEQVLNRLNIPSKRDIDELSIKIAQLAARIEELRQTRQ